LTIIWSKDVVWKITKIVAFTIYSFTIHIYDRDQRVVSEWEEANLLTREVKLLAERHGLCFQKDILFVKTIDRYVKAAQFMKYLQSKTETGSYMLVIRLISLCGLLYLGGVAVSSYFESEGFN
jgi:hypothetical protein